MFWAFAFLLLYLHYEVFGIRGTNFCTYQVLMKTFGDYQGFDYFVLLTVYLSWMTEIELELTVFVCLGIRIGLMMKR